MIGDENYYQECVDAVRVLKMKFDLDSIAEKYLAVYISLCKQASESFHKNRE
jgi:hypothetical protein